MKKRRKRLKIGDIVEMETCKGLAYAQYVYEHREPPELGSLVRVLQGFHDEQPDLQTIERLVKKPHRFVTFTPLGSHIWHGDAIIVGNYPVPVCAQRFPVFKSSVNPYSPDAIWWLWDGKNSWKVGTLSKEEQSQYPTESVYNWGGFLDYVETGEE